MEKDKDRKRKPRRGWLAWDPVLWGSRFVFRRMLPFRRKTLEVGIVLHSSSVFCVWSRRAAHLLRLNAETLARQRKRLTSLCAVLYHQMSKSLSGSDSGIFDRYILVLISFLTNYFSTSKKHLETWNLSTKTQPRSEIDFLSVAFYRAVTSEHMVSGNTRLSGQRLTGLAVLGDASLWDSALGGGDSFHLPYYSCFSFFSAEGLYLVQTAGRPPRFNRPATTLYYSYYLNNLRSVINLRNVCNYQHIWH